MAAQQEDMLMMERTEGEEQASTELPFPNAVG